MTCNSGYVGNMYLLNIYTNINNVKNAKII